MNEPPITQTDFYDPYTHDYDSNFLSGISCLFNAEYKEARKFFLAAVYDGYPLEEHYSVYQSYLGLSNVLIDYKYEILNHCYHSTDDSLPTEPEVQLNLACAEFIKGNRGRAFQAMEKIKDQELSADISKDINSFFNLVGQREEAEDGSMKRDKLIYQSMGKLFRKRHRFDASDIEGFIINTTKKRYQSMMLN